MYIPRRYEEKDKDKIAAFIRENSFALLVSVHQGIPVATHLPLLLKTGDDGKDRLLGHISKGNDQKISLQNGVKVLAVFAGPHAYVSPAWYTKMNVPTWNYISVHVYGTVSIMEGEALKQALSGMVDFYEQGRTAPVKLEHIPEKTFEDDFRGIIGFEILIDEIQAAYKLSQNRDEQSYHQVIHELSKGDELSKKVAEEMQARQDGLFGK